MDYKKKYLKYKAKYLNTKKQIKGGDAGRTYGRNPQTGRAERTQQPGIAADIKNGIASLAFWPCNRLSQADCCWTKPPTC